MREMNEVIMYKVHSLWEWSCHQHGIHTIYSLTKIKYIVFRYAIWITDTSLWTPAERLTGHSMSKATATEGLSGVWLFMMTSKQRLILMGSQELNNISWSVWKLEKREFAINRDRDHILQQEWKGTLNFFLVSMYIVSEYSLDLRMTECL